MPRWLSLLFVVALAVMVYQTGQQQREVRENPLAAGGPTKAYPAIRDLTDAEHWKKSLDPDYAKAMRACEPVAPKEGKRGMVVVVDALGEGEGAKCGEKIRLRLTRWDAQGNADAKTEADIVLGQSGIAGLDAALLDLRMGGVRTLIIPATATAAKTPLRPFIPANRLTLLTIARIAPEPQNP